MKTSTLLETSSLVRCASKGQLTLHRCFTHSVSTTSKVTVVPSVNKSWRIGGIASKRLFCEGQTKQRKFAAQPSAEPESSSTSSALESESLPSGRPSPTVVAMQQRLTQQPQMIGSQVTSSMDMEPPEISVLLKSIPLFIRDRILRMSPVKKLAALLFIVFTCIGDYLDRQFVEFKDTEKSYSFLPGGAEEHILMNLHTGDLVCFARPLFSYNPLNSLRVVLRQFIADGPYEHCGMIIRNQHDGNQAYVLELNLNTSRLDKYIAQLQTWFARKNESNNPNKLSLDNQLLKTGYKLTTFEERVLNSREVNICVRSVRSSSMVGENLRRWSDWVEYHTTLGAFTYANMTEYDDPSDFVDDSSTKDNNNSNDEWGNTKGPDSVNVHKMNDSENRMNYQRVKEINDLLLNEVCYYRDTIKQLLLVMIAPGDNTIALRSRIRELKRNIRLIEHDIATQKAKEDYVEVPKDILIRSSNQLKTVFRGARNTEEMESEHRKLYVNLVLKNRTLKERCNDVNPHRLIRTPEMMGKIWIDMGFLDKENGVKPCEIRHQHFTDQTMSIPLNDNSTLANIVYVRTGFEVGEKINADERPL